MKLPSHNKTGLRSIYLWAIAIFLIITSFLYYSRENEKRIYKQNESYAAEATLTQAKNLDSEFDDAIKRIETYAYFVGQRLTKPEFDNDVLQEIGKLNELSAFDAFRFVDKDGINHSVDGIVCDASDRNYYIYGMQGKSGMAVQIESRITGEPVISFYAPIRYNDEIVGVLCGVYEPEEYLRQLLGRPFLRRLCRPFYV
jgi:hypothetical protein